MGTATREWTVSSALSDPLIRTLMIADNVDSGRTRIDAAPDREKGCANFVADDQGQLSPPEVLPLPGFERSAASSPKSASGQ